MDDLTFLDTHFGSEVGESDAILKAVLPGGKVMHVADTICPSKFIESCPLLYHAFEYNAQGRLQANIEASSESAVISLVRYCYTGTYLADEPDGESVQLLQHAETYKIAEDFDVPALQIMAHGNFSCQIEYSCCLPNSPDDLLDTIRFLYQNFASDEARRKHNLVDTLLNYCVAVYLIHKLGENLDFLTAVHELPAFRQDLCRTNIVRNFEDDCAAQIIRLPDGPKAESSTAPTTLASRDLPTDMYYNFPPVPAPATSTAFAASAYFQQSTQPTMLSYRHNVQRARPPPCEIPDVSKHSVSPVSLAAALQEFRDNAPSESDDEDAELDAILDAQRKLVDEQMLRNHKRARFEYSAARLGSRPELPGAGAGPSSEMGPFEYNSSARAAVDAEDEDLYWAGATPDPTVASQPASIGATFRRTLQEEDTATTAPALSASTATLRAPNTLPYRRRAPSPPSDAGFTTDTASEDEGYSVIKQTSARATRVPHSLMSSPEIVPTPSIAGTMSDRNAESEDEWTML